MYSRLLHFLVCMFVNITIKPLGCVVFRKYTAFAHCGIFLNPPSKKIKFNTEVISQSGKSKID